MVYMNFVTQVIKRLEIQVNRWYPGNGLLQEIRHIQGKAKVKQKVKQKPTARDANVTETSRWMEWYGSHMSVMTTPGAHFMFTKLLKGFSKRFLIWK